FTLQTVNLPVGVDTPAGGRLLVFLQFTVPELPSPTLDTSTLTVKLPSGSALSSVFPAELPAYNVWTEAGSFLPALASGQNLAIEFQMSGTDTWGTGLPNQVVIAAVAYHLPNAVGSLARSHGG